MIQLFILVAASGFFAAGTSCARRPEPPPDGPVVSDPAAAPTGAPPADVPSRPGPAGPPAGEPPRGEEPGKPAPAPGSLPKPDQPPPPPGGAPARKAAEEAPVTMKPAAKAKPAARPAPSSSLGGHDRHLVLKPFERLTAADFELGALAPETADPGFRSLLDAIGAGLVSGTLPLDRFSDRAAVVARVLFDGDALAGIASARFSAPATGPGGVASATMRVFARRGGDAGEWPARAALGLLIAAPDEAGAWKVEHFELDLAALEAPLERKGPWDPYDDSAPR